MAHGPNLDDPTLFDRREGVPILDVHTRGGRHVDAARLALIVENSNARAALGDPALLFIGHTDDRLPEKDQPPLAGYAKNYAMGEHAGRPCIVADLYQRRDDPALRPGEFPRRSVEVYYSDSVPAHNYIDAIALLKTSPERDLGLVPYRGTRLMERYSLAPGPDPEPAPGTEPAPAPTEPAPTSGPEPAPETPQEPAAMPLSPEDLQAIIQGVVTAMKPAEPAPEPEPAPAEEPPADPEPAAEPEAGLSDAEKENLRKTQEGITLERYRADKRAQDARMAELDQRNKDLERYNRKADRKADLVQLVRDGYDLDLAETLEELVDEPAEKYAKSLDRIRKNYKRSVDGQPRVEIDPSAPPRRSGDDALTREDMPKLAKYQRDNPGLSYEAALERYKADKRDGKLAR